MNALRIGLVTAACLLAVVACTPREEQLLLSEMPRFTGHVRIQLRSPDHDPRTVEGDVAFDRDAKNRQLTLRGEQTVSLLRRADGSLGAFIDGRPETPTAAHHDAFAVLDLALDLQLASDAAVERSSVEDGVGRYAVRQSPIELHVDVEPTRVIPGH